MDTYLAAIADLRASQYPSATRRETSTCAREKVDRHWYPKSTPPTNNQIATCFNTQQVQDQTKNGLHGWFHVQDIPTTNGQSNFGLWASRDKGKSSSRSLRAEHSL